MPAREVGPICSPSGCSALGMASATRSRFDGEELVVIYQSSTKDKARRGGGQPGSAGIHWRQELASGTIPARLQDAERYSSIAASPPPTDGAARALRAQSLRPLFSSRVG